MQTSQFQFLMVQAIQKTLFAKIPRGGEGFTSYVMDYIVVSNEATDCIHRP